jgi:large subunit ribosomal protein L4
MAAPSEEKLVCDTQSIDPVSLIGYENVVITEAALKKVEGML